MEELIFAGNKYISSKRAAKLTGYTTDYIGQMCRAEKMDCRLVGRNWYINEGVAREQKKSFKKEQDGDIGKIKYKKIELEPMYYSSDERSNNPEITKIYTEDEARDAEENIKEIKEIEKPIPIRIIKEPEISVEPVERYEQPQAALITERQIAPKQIPKPQITAMLAPTALLVGILLLAGTLTLEQVIRYSSLDKNNIRTNFQLANIITSTDIQIK